MTRTADRDFTTPADSSLRADLRFIAISDYQRRGFPDLDFVGTIPNAIDVEHMPFSADKDDYLLFIGRMTPDKGAHTAIDVAKTADNASVSAGDTIGFTITVTNLGDQGVIPPDNVVRHDDDDPYLVVAADKGTATFSDIANDVAQSYGFWLGDAFASGGSVGYDHKAMGITARGAWESVKRHFRELDMDPAEDEFTTDQVMTAIAQTYRPEFQNRLDKVIVFQPLTREAIDDIFDLEMDKIRQRYAQVQEIELRVTPERDARLSDQAQRLDEGGQRSDQDRRDRELVRAFEDDGTARPQRRAHFADGLVEREVPR